MTVKNISKIIKLCYENYDKKTMAHVLRVADYALNNILANSIERDVLYITALCHDLIEDTNICIEDIRKILEPYNSQSVINALTLLTKPIGMDYIEYIKQIKSSNNKLAVCVKFADMKDHLMEKETLTDKLKEKYLNALPYLL